MPKRKDYIGWDEYFMGVALLAGERSKDPNSQVGACIVSEDNKILSIGYNGFPNGCSDDEVSWERTDMNTSFFFNRILRGFYGEADKNRDKKVTARELFNYVNPGVISDTNGMQHPQMWGKFDDSMVIVYIK